MTIVKGEKFHRNSLLSKAQKDFQKKKSYFIFYIFIKKDRKIKKKDSLDNYELEWPLVLKGAM